MTTHPDQPRPENTHAVESDATAAPFLLAVRVVAGDLPATSDAPFNVATARGPDWFDKRVILQDQIWVDRRAHQHRLDQMTPDYRANVLTFLQHKTSGWTTTAVTWELAAAISGVIPGRDAADHLELLELLTPGWADHTPLGRRLHELNQTQPHPLAPPRPRTTADHSDHPEVLRDTDAGLWHVTTVSGTVYLVDLDRRRVQRQPQGAAPSNGDPPQAASKPLPGDHEWTVLDCLIRCRTGTGLALTDLRPDPEHHDQPDRTQIADTHPGIPTYRLSTDVIQIRRAADPISTPACANET